MTPCVDSATSKARVGIRIALYAPMTSLESIKSPFSSSLLSVNGKCFRRRGSFDARQKNSSGMPTS